MNKAFNLIDKLERTHSLSLSEYEFLLSNYCAETYEYARKKAVKKANEVYGNKVYIRGLIEISNYCKNDCYYCGIRKSNKIAQRYRLTKDEILACCETGYKLGFRTFVMQGGEDAYFTDEFLTDIISEIKRLYPDCAVTLSLGERTKESYQSLFTAGADRYLLRHETANKQHYSMLHPQRMSYDERMKCLQDLKEIGFQVGCGFMVGSPHQTVLHLAEDLKFVEEFQPDMCGVGPYIRHADTPFKDEKSGSVQTTLFLLSLIRLIKPNILLPATTALGSLTEGGREKGILSGANVVMPNLSPTAVRSKYLLYDNKLSTGAESAQKLNELRKIISEIGYEISTDRGDIIK